MSRAKGRAPGRTQAECARCSLVMPLRARGLCSTCHSAARRGGVLHLYPRVNAIRKPAKALPATWGDVGETRPAPPPAPPAADTPSVRLVFDGPDDRALFARLEAVAQRKRRSVEQQILYVLEHDLELVAPEQGA